MTGRMVPSSASAPSDTARSLARRSSSSGSVVATSSTISTRPNRLRSRFSSTAMVMAPPLYRHASEYEAISQNSPVTVIPRAGLRQPPAPDPDHRQGAHHVRYGLRAAFHDPVVGAAGSGAAGRPALHGPPLPGGPTPSPP